MPLNPPQSTNSTAAPASNTRGDNPPGLGPPPLGTPRGPFGRPPDRLRIDSIRSFASLMAVSSNSVRGVYRPRVGVVFGVAFQEPPRTTKHARDPCHDLSLR